ncbi:hypothetical protein F5B20DRAFT_588029 [Whalleya microplaca]|nr:hypothetical protein F5B20DRAFT_588029 [Whalleya microplaca]
MKRRMKTVFHEAYADIQQASPSRNEIVEDRSPPVSWDLEGINYPNEDAQRGTSGVPQCVAAANGPKPNEASTVQTINTCNSTQAQTPNRSLFAGHYVGNTEDSVGGQPEQLKAYPGNVGGSEERILQPQEGRDIRPSQSHNAKEALAPPGYSQARTKIHGKGKNRRGVSSTGSYYTPSSLSDAAVGSEQGRRDTYLPVSSIEMTTGNGHHTRSHDLLRLQGINDIENGEDSLAKALEGVLDLSDTTDADQGISYAPAVTHETIHPHIHEIKEEQIYREIHNHDVYHRIQPIIDVEVLPARHFVPGPDGSLVEVSENELPNCTGVNQSWSAAEQLKISAPPPCSKDSLEIGTAQAGDEKECITPEGFQRTETNVVHAPTLEDISNISESALRVEFDEYGFRQDVLSKEGVHVQDWMHARHSSSSSR